IGGGKELAEHLEAALAPAHAREPVVDKGDPRGAGADGAARGGAIGGPATGGHGRARGGGSRGGARGRLRPQTQGPPRARAKGISTFHPVALFTFDGSPSRIITSEGRRRVGSVLTAMSFTVARPRRKSSTCWIAHEVPEQRL